MAELDTSGGGGKKGGKVRSKKSSTKVDLTAMVDLAFLLITFFMLTTTLNKPIAMDIAKPDKDEKNEQRLELRASQTMTILLGKNNKVAWYMGEAGKSAPEVQDFTQIRKSILDNKQKVQAASGKSIVMVIKPTSGATYKNFVDIMDELAITGIKSAPAIDDENITDAEKAFMKSQNLL
ncbi:biopolymer transport protein ExbD [Pedobacter cryoconitis]|jgi:biopolymer transport protein ExbD|uniref:Biopolymer transport protein ExbD n=1 Tax=Pedobacter cryoconitis TaxID=188932 RepID=A0A7W8YVI6_9SPHI|nr:biopolymer transporter ExbD [Pedobacter cryoconitis]MBB5622442.1 biopolymer transport protein ExbD [Pedobacter cryoconitis]MBB5647595.1 biopolymer transport protein ExbD [Pedobacter cryoconitis]